MTTQLTVGCGPTRRQMMARPWLVLTAATLIVAGIAVSRVRVSADEDTGLGNHPLLDPTQWGSDHVGQRIPDYVTGDECLFCHRDVGPSWPDNRHQLTIRPAAADDPALMKLLQHEPGLKNTIHFIMGDERTVRFLKRSDAYGKLDLFTAKYLPPSDDPKRDGTIKHVESASWDKHAFGQGCAGCHTTAVETDIRAFAATSIDCFACHGNVDLNHTKDPKVALLSKENQPPRVVISVCGQCHLRGGKSQSSGLPYPNTFVAGDNLFRDFRVDLSAQAINQLAPIERHMFENTRDVALLGRTETTCLTCHDVHAQDTEKHQALNETHSCSTCHEPGSDNTRLRESFINARGPRNHNEVCDY